MFLIRYLCLFVLTIIPMAIAHDFLQTVEDAARLQRSTLSTIDSLRVRLQSINNFGETLRKGSEDNSNFIIELNLLEQLNEVITDTDNYIRRVFEYQPEKSAVPLEDDENPSLNTLDRYTEKITELYNIAHKIYVRIYGLSDYEFKDWIYTVYSQSDEEVHGFSQAITSIAAANIELMSTEEIESSGFNMMASICRGIGYFINPEKRAHTDLKERNYSIYDEWASIIRDFNQLEDFIQKLTSPSED